MYYIKSANYRVDRALDRFFADGCPNRIRTPAIQPKRVPQQKQHLQTPAESRASAPIAALFKPRRRGIKRSPDKNQPEVCERASVLGHKRSRAASPDDAATSIGSSAPLEAVDLEGLAEQRARARALRAKKFRAALKWKTPKLLGEMVIEGLSTTRGRHVLHAGDCIDFVRQAPEKRKAIVTSRLLKGHRRQTLKSTKKARQRVLRFKRGELDFWNSLEIGKVPAHVSEILAPLFDRKFIDIEVSCISCPENLQIFDGILLNVQVYARPAFFYTYQSASLNGTRARAFDAAASGTDDEEDRFRHVNLFLQALKLVGCRPRRENAATSPGAGSSSSGKAAAALDGKRHQSGGDGELSDQQLQALYEGQNVIAADLPMAEQPAGLKCTLRGYQRQAVWWMLRREGGNGGVSAPEHSSHDRPEEKGRSKKRHPLWEEYRFSDGTPFYVNPYSLEVSILLPESRAAARGGILADEMGMGKTVQAIALMLANPPTAPLLRQALRESAAAQAAGVTHTRAGTLVVCPMSLIGQWQDEVRRHSRLSVFVYYGADRGGTAWSDYDVVITSFGTLSSEVKADRGGVHCVMWWRVILDEAHSIRNSTTESAKSAYAIEARHRWCLTGTPLQNRIDDLFSLLHFLREEPWASRRWWKRVIAQPHEKGDPRGIARLKAVLHPLLLRRTKTMKDVNGKRILDIPPLREEIVRLQFTPEERDIYNSLFHKSKTKFDAFVRQGVVLNKYVEILTLLLRLRQACDHPFLVLGRERSTQDLDRDLEQFYKNFTSRVEVSAGAASAAPAGGDGGKALSLHYVQGLMNDLKKGGQECPICLDLPELPVVTQCGHFYCRECVSSMFNSRGWARCAICRSDVYSSNLFKVPTAARPGTEGRVQDLRHSSKTRQLLVELEALRSEDRSIKSVVFSQFTHMLDLVEAPLKQRKFRFVRLDGSMSRSKRERVLKQFREDPSTTLFLISLKAGGVGLNLVQATRVFFLDVWWNPAAEDQATQRVHRIGQTKPVVVKRFIVDGTVEESILELQKRKKFLAASVEGMTSSESQKLNMNDLSNLFSFRGLVQGKK